MKVSINWLKELVNLNCSLEELTSLLPLRTIGTKEVTEDFIELDMKGYNRADLLSMRGVAMEVAAVTGSKLRFEEPQETKFAWNQVKLPSTKVGVKDTTLCPFYCLAKIEGLKVDPSNENWVKKLNDSGVRSINSIADITNLTMLEYGQPLHAFDADKVAGEEIIVRTANTGEELVTLDGKKRALASTNLLITDKQKALGLAGVMGGENSEVTGSTKTILLEAAIFDPINIRKTAINQGLTSEASKRFQHGLTKTRLLQALNAAIKMYEELGGKVTAVTIIGDFEDKVKKITLSKSKLEDLVGVKFEDKQVEKYLKLLGFTLASQGEALRAWEVTVPYWRLDIELEEDLIEEVARMYGYEKIPAGKVSEGRPLQKEEPIFKTISDLKNKLVEQGLTEVQTYSFYSTTVLNNLSWDTKNLIKVANPISAETEYLRENLWSNLLEVIAKNFRQGVKDMAVFEIGKVYRSGEDGQPTESYRLSLSLYNGSDNPIQELYQIFQKISHLGGVTLGNSKMGEYEKKYFHPKRFAFLDSKGEAIGEIAEVHKRYTDNFGVKNRVAVLEIELAEVKW